MPFPEDLLEQAQHLALQEKRKPKQASLRRAVSAAYYTLFHLLIQEAARNWKRRDQRAAFARTFDHAKMRKASNTVISGRFTGCPAQAVADLKEVGSAFVQLQDSRHLADYDNAKSWSRSDTLRAVNRARTAFEAWRAVRSERIAQDYLFELIFLRR